jgi:hypothetical protein
VCRGDFWHLKSTLFFHHASLAPESECVGPTALYTADEKSGPNWMLITYSKHQGSSVKYHLIPYPLQWRDKEKEQCAAPRILSPTVPNKFLSKFLLFFLVTKYPNPILTYLSSDADWGSGFVPGLPLCKVFWYLESLFSA